MVGQSAGKCIPFLRCGAENDDRRSCAISATLLRAGEKAVDVIEEIQQLPVEVSATAVREVRIISPTKYSRSFPLISITHLPTVQEEGDPRKFGDAFRPTLRGYSPSREIPLLRGDNQEEQVVRSFARFASRLRT